MPAAERLAPPQEPAVPEETAGAAVAPEWGWFLPGSPILIAPSADAAVQARLDSLAYLPVLERNGRWAQIVFRGATGWSDTDWEPPHDRGSARQGILRRRAEPIRGNDPWRLRAAQEILGVRRSDVKVGEYRLFTDVEDAELLAFLDGAAIAAEEAYFARYGRLPSGDPVRSAVLFAEEAKYREFSAEEASLLTTNSSGHAGSGVLAFFAEGRPRGELARTLVHEITHLVNDRALAVSLPPWLEEGMASDLGAVWTEPFPTPDAGSEPADRLSLAIQKFETDLIILDGALSGGVLPHLMSLLTLDRKEFYEGSSGGAYANSAAFIRYVLDEDEGLADGFRTFLRRIATGTQGRLLELLERDAEALNRGYRAWLQAEAAESRSRLERLSPGMEISASAEGRVNIRYSGGPPRLRDWTPGVRGIPAPPTGPPPPDTPSRGPKRAELSVSFRALKGSAGNVVVDPVVVHQVEPSYPAPADRPDEGLLVWGTVDASGTLIDLSVVLGVGLELDAAFLDAVRQWRFTPGTVNGEPAAFAVTVLLTFESG